MCDCYETEGPPDDGCEHPTEKREAYVDELTDAQMKFIYLAKQERERMKQEKAEEKQNKNQLKEGL